MKKFLSSLLALTMILSLVIVPANAGSTPSGSATPNVSGATGSNGAALVGDTLTFTLTNLSVTDDRGTVGETLTPNVTWSVGGHTIESNSYTVASTDNGTLSVTYTGTISYQLTTTDDAARASSTQTVDISGRTSVTVSNPQADFSAAAKKITYQGREYSVPAGATPSVTIDKFTEDPDFSASNLNVSVTGYTITSSNVSYASGTGTLTVKAGSNESDPSVAIAVNSTSVSGQTLTLDKGSSATIYEGQKISLTATYSRASEGKNVRYEWSTSGGSVSSSTNTATFTAPTTVSADTDYTVTCTVKEGATIAKTATITITVKDDPYSPNRNGESSSKTIATNNSSSCSIAAPVLKSTNNTIYYRSGNTDTFDITWAVKSGSNLINEPVKSSSTGDATVTAKSGAKSGTAVVTATITYMGKEYPALEYTIDISALDAELSSIVNGDSDSYRQSDIQEKLADAIKKQDSSFRYNDVKTITVVGTPSRVTLKDGKTTLSNGSSVTDGFTIYADEAYIGDASFQLKVNNNYVVTMYLTVDSKGEIKDTVTGTSAGKSVTFTNSDYDYLYIYEGSTSFKSDMYNGDWSRTSNVSRNWKPVAENKDYTVSSSAFDRNGKATLYVVAVDNNIASTGTIEVSQKSYAIEYNVVAGETLSFDQKAFESFMNDYADDNISTSKGDYFEFDYVKFTSLPNSTREGVLYEGKDKIKTSTEVENLDKVSFESVAKAKDTIKVPFTLYAKQYDKNDKVIDKKVSMTGEVVISVVKEDIVFEVGVNSAVKLGSDKFIDFLRDSDKSYKKADLDYVTFDVGKNSAITSYFNGTGALYRYYNGSTGINATVSAKDEFYYNPKTSSKHYDLDDVTYVTSKFAKVGDIVYIPFTAYGTKSGQKAEGTLAIKVKQTMNFVDVRPGDYFYDSVQWAVNLDITKGTSATTFSPKQGCTRAQIVTFLWRAANSPAPRSSTNKFTDVYATTHADYMKAIIWATEQGITTGTGNGKFSPDATCTRAQIVTFLYRYKNNPAVYGSLNFSDVNKTEHAAFYNAILWAVNNKITTGYGGGIFDPNGTCNRGDAVTFLYRALA